jgi:hypothetical protein
MSTPSLIGGGRRKKSSLATKFLELSIGLDHRLGSLVVQWKIRRIYQYCVKRKTFKGTVS